MRTNPFDDQFFRRQVSFSNKIYIALVGNSRAAESGGKDASGVASCLNGKVEQAEFPKELRRWMRMLRIYQSQASSELAKGLSFAVSANSFATLRKDSVPDALVLP